MIAPATAPGREDVARHYDHLDRWYRELWGEHVHHGLWRTGRETPREAAEELVREVAFSARLGRGDSVCDVGSGYGAPAALLAREHGARVTGFTVSPVQYERAVARADAAGEGALRFHLRDWMENGMPDASFDAVVSIECASHVADKARFLSEVRRVLRPGGRAALCVWAAAERTPGWEERALLQPLCREGRLPGLATESEYLGWMRGAGLRQCTSRDLGRNVRKTWTVCLRRGALRFLSDRELRAFVLSGDSPERVYGWSLMRLWLASRTGSFRYLLLSGAR